VSTLPIIVPGPGSIPTRTVNVPCALPPSFCFDVFLPARGIRPFCAWLSSTDPLKAEVQDVTLAKPEKDARFHGVGSGGAYSLDEDEEKRADEAAGDVFRALFARLLPVAQHAGMPENSTLEAIAHAWEAECKAVEAGTSLYRLFLGDKSSAASDINALIPDLTNPDWQRFSTACEAMRCYVAKVIEEAQVAQIEKAERMEATWEAPSHHEDFNPPAWAERHGETP
jgi:hypothetical protein